MYEPNRFVLPFFKGLHNIWGLSHPIYVAKEEPKNREEGPILSLISSLTLTSEEEEEEGCYSWGSNEEGRKKKGPSGYFCWASKRISFVVAFLWESSRIKRRAFAQKFPSPLSLFLRGGGIFRIQSKFSSKGTFLKERNCFFAATGLKREGGG